LARPPPTPPRCRRTLAQQTEKVALKAVANTADAVEVATSVGMPVTARVLRVATALRPARSKGARA
jgi:hypothetical protein